MVLWARSKKKKKIYKNWERPESMVFEFPLYTQLSKVKNSLQNATAKNTRLPPQQLPIRELSSWKEQDISSLHSALMYLRSSVLGKFGSEMKIFISHSVPTCEKNTLLGCNMLRVQGSKFAQACKAVVRYRRGKPRGDFQLWAAPSSTLQRVPWGFSQREACHCAANSSRDLA